MQTARAATLLAAARSADDLAPLAAAAGVDGPAATLDRRTRTTLGLDPALAAARVAAGPGALRALLATARPDVDLRHATRLTAAALAARSPLLLWLAILIHPRDGIAIAAWTPAPSPAPATPPRVAALLCDPGHILASDADTLAALAAAASLGPPAGHSPGADALLHARWLDALGRESLGRRFYRHLEHVVGALAASCHTPSSPPPPTDRAELALLYTSRLLFLAFLASKGWLDGDRAFLARTLDDTLASGGDYHRRTLLPLFFGTLNTPPRHRAPTARAFGRIPFLNGGLFAPTPLERRLRRARFGDAELAAVVDGLLARYRFTPREDATAWTEAAVDPEMLGRAFESLMSARDRRATGAFYTPQHLVGRVTTAALHAALDGDADPRTRAALDATFTAAHTGAPPPAAGAAALRARLATLRILDPACGSGAFLVHALERVADLRAAAGDPRPIPAIRRETLARSIFGVDVNPTAVWLCELRLWLSVVIDADEPDPRRVPPLPNLDHNVRVGDALASPLHPGPSLAPPTRGAWGGDPWSLADAHPATPRSPHRAPRLTDLRARYAGLAGARKLPAATRLADEERRHAMLATDRALATLRARRHDLVAAARGRDLFGARLGLARADARRLRALRTATRDLAARRRALARGAALPFGFPWHFADAGHAGGFDAVIGNPPWVRPHALPAADRARLRLTYRACGHAAWRDGARLAGAGTGFGGQADLAVAFAERALALARPGGAVALLLPAKLWRSLAGGGLRHLLLHEADPLALEDWSDAPPTFDASTYPSLLVARRRPTRATPAPPTDPPPRTRAPVHIHVHRAADTLAFDAPAHRLPLDDSPGSPWLLLPPRTRRAFDRLRSAGPPLGHSPLARLSLGVKCGCNAAYLVHLVDEDGEVATVRGPDGPLDATRPGRRSGAVERALLRPLLRGESLGRHDDTPRHRAARILWTHDPLGAPLATLPPLAAAWLSPWRDRLRARADTPPGDRWWSIFRPAAADPTHARVVWPDVARAPRATVLPPGDPTVPLNSCYVATCADETDAHALAALLRSPLIAAWLGALAEPARGGYRRHLAWTVALLPIPRDWTRARAILAPLATLGADLPTLATAYDLPERDLAPLVARPRHTTPIGSRTLPPTTP